MSIYIKNMEMPKDGELLCINIYPDGKVCINLDMQCKQIATAVPVQPHGRLIDADALYEVVKKRTRNWAGGWDDITCVLTGNDIKNAPTIIPAEEGE